MVRFHQAVVFLETEQLVEFAQATDKMGYAGICLSDHLFYPRHLRSRYPYSPFEDGSPPWSPETDWPDCWCLASAMAAGTEKLTFTTNAYIPPARDLFTVAKLVGTTAVISRGRVQFGAAAGWCAEEFAATGQEFRTRGRRLAEMIAALRALWSPGWTEFHGEFYDFGPLQMRPVPPGPIPIYLGGQSEVAMRRAATLADGWLGADIYSVDRAIELTRTVRRYRDEAGRSQEDFAVFLGVDRANDAATVEQLAEAGITDLICAPWFFTGGFSNRSYGSSLQEKIDAAARFADTVIAKVRT